MDGSLYLTHLREEPTKVRIHFVGQGDEAICGFGTRIQQIASRRSQRRSFTRIKMKNEIKISEEIISSKIYWIRNQKIMLDRDLAELYGVDTKVLKQSVRRNLKRFPKDFMFEMKKKELQDWRSQNVTSNNDKLGLRYAPFCFTKQGVTMLACILKSDRAIAVNIQIIRVFTKMRKVLTDTLALKLEIEEIKKKLSENGKNIGLVFDYLDELIQRDKNTEPRKRIGYKLE